MVFCDFVVCIYLIFGESSLQLIEVLQVLHKSSKIDVTYSKPEMIFNQTGVVSAKVGLVKQILCYVCPPPPPPPTPLGKKKSCMKPYLICNYVTCNLDKYRLLQCGEFILKSILIFKVGMGNVPSICS